MGGVLTHPKSNHHTTLNVLACQTRLSVQCTCYGCKNGASGRLYDCRNVSRALSARLPDCALCSLLLTADMLPSVTNSALGGGVQLAAFVQDRQQQQSFSGLLQHRSSWVGPLFTRAAAGAALRPSAAAACGLLVVASACCPPRPRSGRLQVRNSSDQQVYYQQKGSVQSATTGSDVPVAYDRKRSPRMPQQLVQRLVLALQIRGWPVTDLLDQHFKLPGV